MRSSKDDRIGDFRDGKVVVGHRELIKDGSTTIRIKHEPPAHKKDKIEKLILDLVLWVNSANDVSPILRAGIFHHWFVYIHPFYDRNGRVTRLLTSYILIRSGYEVTRYFILDDYYDIDRFEYSDKLHSADKGDHTEWLEYFTEGMLYSLHAAIGEISELKDERLEGVKGEKRALVTKREEDVLRVVMELKAVRSTDISKKLSISRQQAFRLLSSLVGKGILNKHGKTKASYYELDE